VRERLVDDHVLEARVQDGSEHQVVGVVVVLVGRDHHREPSRGATTTTAFGSHTNPVKNTVKRTSCQRPVRVPRPAKKIGIWYDPRRPEHVDLVARFPTATSRVKTFGAVGTMWLLLLASGSPHSAASSLLAVVAQA